MIDYLDNWSFQSYFRHLLGLELVPFDRRWSIRKMIIGSLCDTDLLHRAARTSDDDDDDYSHLSCHLRWCPCRPWRPVLTSRGGVPQVHGYSVLKSTALLTKVCVWRRDIDLRTETKPPISCRLNVRLAWWSVEIRPQLFQNAKLQTNLSDRRRPSPGFASTQVHFIK